MSREAIGLGDPGPINITPQDRVDGRWVTASNPRKAQRHRARAYFRGWDGVRRETSAVGPTSRDASDAVERQLDELLRLDDPAGRVMTPRTSLLQAGEIWLEQAARTDSRLSAKTVSDYSAAFDRNVAVPGSPVRGLTLEQVNDPQRLRLFLQAVADRRGTAAAKMLRSVLSRILGYAVDNGVLESNAVRELGRVRSQVPRIDHRDRKRAFTREELASVLDFADQLAATPSLNARTQRKWETAAVLAAFMAGTGVRIAEARATRWDHVDLASGRYAVPGTKSANSRRTLNLPSWLVERLQLRIERVGSAGFIFSAPALLGDPETEWEQSNCASAVRSILDGAGMHWAVPHTFRKTVATRLHENGVYASRISDQLGHADPSFTIRTYIGREPEGDKSDLAALL